MTTKTRPYWHVDAKWISGLLLTGLLSVLLVLAGLWQVTRRETAVALFVEAGMSTLYPAPQAGRAFDEMLAQAREQPDAPVVVLGLELPLRGREIADLNREEAARLAFRRLGEIFYDEGPEGLERLRLPEGPGFLGEEGSGPLALFNAQGHRLVGLVLGAVGLIALLLFIPVIYFSARWGRLASPGVCLLVASVPGGLPLVAIATLSLQGEGPPLPVRLVSRAAAPAYGLAAASGLALIVVALVGGVIGWLRRR